LKGNRVFGSGQGSFAKLIAVNALDLRRISDEWPFTDAAGLALLHPLAVVLSSAEGNSRRLKQS